MAAIILRKILIYNNSYSEVKFKKKWYICNDERVVETEHPLVDSSSAYIVLYELKENDLL